MSHVQRPGHGSSKATVLTLPCKLFGKSVSFLIDSGAECSVVPRNLIPSSIIFSSNLLLTGVNDSPIVNFGKCTCSVAVPGLRRVFNVNFIVSNTKPILGADFLTQYKLQLDMSRRQLADPRTSLTASLHSNPSQSVQIRVSGSRIMSELPDEFSVLRTAPNYADLPVTSVTHVINTNGPPLHCKPRPLSPAKLEIAKKEFDALLKLNIIRPSKSPWSSPLHMVKKSDGSWRPCGDYRRVNAVTVPDSYPLPNMQHFHHRLSGATLFTKLDLVKAYHFIPVQPSDVEKTAITTPFGAFEYVRMPFGLRNSSGTFQRFIDSLLRDMPFALSYLDDILIFSKNVESHRTHTTAVLNKLKEAGLRIKEEKCCFAQSQLDFLGYTVDAQGIKPPRGKVEALKNLPPPSDTKELVRYLGMFGFYQRCIPNYASLTLPLRAAACNKDFTWTSEHDDAFAKLKDHLATATQLAFPNTEGDFIITTDASKYAIGACLNQTIGDTAQPISFFSRKLSNTECRYSAFDRELLAAYAAVKKWRYFIDGHTTTLFTDHKPLVGAFRNTTPRLSDKQQRQLSFLAEKISDIVHIAGNTNVVADTLSRSSQLMSLNAAEPPLDLPAIASAQATSGDDYNSFTSFDIGSKHPLHCETSQPNPRPVVPDSLRRAIFDALHNLSHPGIKASIRLICTRYFWVNSKSDIKRWCTECLNCQSCKIQKHTHKQIRDLPCPTQRFGTVHMDIVGPLEVTEESSAKYLLTAIDAHTRWLEATPLHDISAASVCDAFLSSWVSRFGPPLTLVTDRGTQFTSELAQRLTALLGIHHIRTSAHNPRANGMVERAHRSLKAALKARGKNWQKQLPIVLFGLRIRPGEDGSSPFSLVTGEQPLVPQVLPANLDMTELSIRLHQLPFHYTPTRPRKINTHIPEKLKTASHVWVRVDRVRKPLEAPYQGPYKKVKMTDDTMTIIVRGKETTVSIDRLKPAVLPAATNDEPFSQPTDEEEAPQTVAQTPTTQKTRSGRRVHFKGDTDFDYS